MFANSNRWNARRNDVMVAMAAEWLRLGQVLQIGVRGGGHMVATIGGAILSAAGAIEFILSQELLPV